MVVTYDIYELSPDDKSRMQLTAPIWGVTDLDVPWKCDKI
jgi:hypothetical protein